VRPSVRSGVILSYLTPALLIGGVVSLVSVYHLNWLARPSRPELSACALLILASACAVLWIATVRRQCRGFGVQLRDMAAKQTLHEIECANPVMNKLTGSINDLIDLAQKSMENASRRVKDLEIQLKVVTVERQDAKAILQSISDAVLVTDPFDELVMANESAGRIFQFDPAKACGTPVDKILKDPKIIELIRDMRQSRSRGGRRIIEHAFPRGEDPRDQDRIFKITLSCVCDRNDGAAGVVAVLHDISREREVAQMKNDFVSNVSHELRTPLASIKAYVEMLLDGEAEDEKTTREFYEVIQSEANRLSRLIDNILSISRIESGLVQINKQPQSLTVILKEAIEVITPQAKSKRITIVEKLTPVFYQTKADKDMLYQAVLNLLSNAVKYTPDAGTVTIETIVDEPQNRVLTKVSDSGVGIPPKDLPFVFDKFYRSEANSRMAKGTGLGLSLVKHIIENVHQGKLLVSSEVGRGSCFSFDLELAA